jgi:hypothetical protein
MATSGKEADTASAQYRQLMLGLKTPAPGASKPRLGHEEQQRAKNLSEKEDRLDEAITPPAHMRHEKSYPKRQGKPTPWSFPRSA